MKDEIITNLQNPAQLEKLYRSDKQNFKHTFKILYPQLKGNILSDFWNERLNYENEEINWGTHRQIFYVVLAALVAGTIAKLPAILNISEEVFYPRNIGFILFPILTAYFGWKNKLTTKKIAFIISATLISVFFINSLPDIKKSNTSILSCIHLLLFLWSVLGFAFVGELKNNETKRLNFLKFNGDLVVITGLILIAGAILTAITIGLFSLINFRIEKFYFEYIGVFGLAAAPIIGTYLVQTNPQIVGKVSPVIAKIFSPLVMVMLVIYLVAIIYSGKNPYNDREFLMMFNALLVGVMALIFFSVTEAIKANKNYTEVWILFFLSVVTVVVNGIAISAIFFRITEWGITPNRIAVLGGNALILIHLLMVTVQLFKVISKKEKLTEVGKAIAWFLPVYFAWTIIVTFIFPFLFGFK